MKRYIKIIMVTALILLYTSIGILAYEPTSSGEAAILLDGKSGRILYAKNIDQKLPMASTTKIMTALVAVEEGNIQDVITIPPEAQGVEGSSIWLSEGEQHTLDDLLYGLMLRSGNDAATAIGYHLGGDIEGFSEMMNKKAYELGAGNSHFINPHGLHHEDHYTTARDLGIITVHALKNPDFKRYVSTVKKTIPWEGHEWDRVMKNKNKLLWQYDGANGVKTGYTKKAGRCLVGSAFRDGMQLVTVVLNCGPMFEDTTNLLDYGFKNYKNHVIINNEQSFGSIKVKDGKSDNVSIISKGSFEIALKDDEKKLIKTEFEYPDVVKAPIEKNQECGKIKVYFDGTLMDEIPIVTAASIEKRTFWDLIKKMLNIWG